MLLGKYQTGVWHLFLVLGVGTGTAWLLGEVLGLGGWLGFAVWLVIVVLAGRIAYVDWRRDGVD
jgi:hypothetical protein